MVRHPAAFVSSLKTHGWFFDFHNLLKQPEAIDTFFPEERNALEVVAQRQFTDIVHEAAVLWRVLHKVILKYRDLYPGWQYVRLEDIARDPLREFRQLAEGAGLADIWQTDEELQRAFRRAGPFQTPDEGKGCVPIWRSRLSAEEIAKVRELTASAAARFYPDAEW
jgi:hypothetical protein